jgi:hypothetical protein
MSKPIFIIKVPGRDPSLDDDSVNHAHKRLSKEMKDYHVLLIRDNRSRGGVKFECYNTSDLRTVDFDYLKWYIKNNLLTQR